MSAKHARDILTLDTNSIYSKHVILEDRYLVTVRAK
jgi:hypothetical protein